MRASAVLCLATIASAAGLLAQHEEIDSQRILIEFLERMRVTLERQPNYTCLETVERTRRSPGGNTQVEDTLRLEVALVDSKEMFAWPGSKEFEDKELTDLISTGMFGNGNFALYPRMLFGGGGPPFVSAGIVEVSGRRAAQYNFRVVRAMSGYQLSVDRRKATVGFHGSFYIDLETLDLRRIELIPDNIPPEFQISAVEDRVDYDRVKIGDERFLLPVESSLMMALPDVVNRNHVVFAGCRKFTGESTLVFVDDNLIGDERQETTPIKEVVLPDQAEVRLLLTSEIVLADGVVGDTIEAKLNSSIKAGKETLVPKGAIAHGRIVKLERQPQEYVLALRFTDMEWKGGHARLNLQFENLSGILPLPRGNPRQAFFRGEGDEIVIQRAGPARLKDLLMYWRAAP